MSVEADLFSTLGPLVSNRCYPLAFPLTPPNPQWPAIRYTLVSTVPMIALCGDSGDEAPDTRVQLDLVAATYSAVRSLRLASLAAMAGFVPPAILENSVDEWDAKTKTFRVTLEYVIYASATA